MLSLHALRFPLLLGRLSSPLDKPTHDLLRRQPDGSWHAPAAELSGFGLCQETTLFGILSMDSNCGLQECSQALAVKLTVYDK